VAKNTDRVDRASGNPIGTDEKMLFTACFVAIVATASVFVVRGQVINAWAAEFALNETEKGEILGVGFWPFAVSIVLFSLVVDRIGYGRSMYFAFACHILSTVILLFAQGYWWLYIGTFVVAMGNGAAQAVADPVVASMFARDKTKWLNILHASWPAGMVAGGMLSIAISSLDWRWRVATVFVPMGMYGLLMLGRRFPVHERVAAGVSYKEMLRETGTLGILLVLLLMFGEVGRVFEWHWSVAVLLSLVCAGTCGWYTRSLGQPMFLFLLVLMIPLATTELGTDSWITSLMEGPMKQLDLNAGWVLIYTSLIMTVLRFGAGPVVKALSPIGLLMVSSLIAIGGLLALSKSTGLSILLAATLYGVGKAYLWPTMLGVVAERFPRGGALSLNITSAVGSMGVGVVGTVFLGMIQDHAVETRLQREQPALHQQIVTDKNSIFGEYTAVDPKRITRLDRAQQETLQTLASEANKSALATVAIFPAIMLVGYVVLLLIFRARGGYSAIYLTDSVTKNSPP
jgi:MFS family permease